MDEFVHIEARERDTASGVERRGKWLYLEVRGKERVCPQEYIK